MTVPATKLYAIFSNCGSSKTSQQDCADLIYTCPWRIPAYAAIGVWMATDAVSAKGKQQAFDE
jgi:hypothetical protein